MFIIDFISEHIFLWIFALLVATIIPPCSKFDLPKISSSLSKLVTAPPAAFKIAEGAAKSQSFGELLPGKLKEM